MENRAAKEDRFGDFLDVAPIVVKKEDLNFLQPEIRKVVAKHEEDCETLKENNGRHLPNGSLGKRSQCDDRNTLGLDCETV